MISAEIYSLSVQYVMCIRICIKLIKNKKQNARRRYYRNGLDDTPTSYILNGRHPIFYVPGEKISNSRCNEEKISLFRKIQMCIWRTFETKYPVFLNDGKHYESRADTQCKLGAATSNAIVIAYSRLK